MKPIKLVVQGIGHAPSFKNSKMLTRGNLITHPRNQKWMELATRHIESGLRCWFPMNETGTGMGRIQQSLIASSLPLDDSLKWIVEHSVSMRRVKKGDEGFEIEIIPVARTTG